MAFDPTPSVWLNAGYAVDTGAHTIILNTNDASSNKLLAQLTDALADPTTGDIRDIMMAICEALYQSWAAVASADRPVKMSVGRTSNGVSGPDTSVGFTYTFRFTINPTVFGVISE